MPPFGFCQGEEKLGSRNWLPSLVVMQQELTSSDDAAVWTSLSPFHTWWLHISFQKGAQWVEAISSTLNRAIFNMGRIYWQNGCALIQSTAIYVLGFLYVVLCAHRTSVPVVGIFQKCVFFFKFLKQISKLCSRRLEVQNRCLSPPCAEKVYSLIFFKKNKIF